MNLLYSLVVAAANRSAIVRRVLRRRTVNDIISVFGKIEDELLSAIAAKDAQVDAIDAQLAALLDTRGAVVDESRRAQRVLSRVGAITA